MTSSRISLVTTRISWIPVLPCNLSCCSRASRTLYRVWVPSSSTSAFHRGWPVCSFASGANISNKALGHNTNQRRRHQIGLDPISTRRATEEASRWYGSCSAPSPVMEALIAISAVSESRISPIMMISGSCRNIERKPLAKVSPAFTFT